MTPATPASPEHCRRCVSHEITPPNVLAPQLNNSGPEIPGWPHVEPSWVGPIVPVTAQWDDQSGKSLSRTQLPLTLAWAMTIHN